MRRPPSLKLCRARKKNKRYWGPELFFAGKSYKCPDIFHSFDLFFFSMKIRFLVFCLRALIFLLLFLSRKKANKNFKKKRTQEFQ